jgi:hypothetical protein
LGSRQQVVKSYEKVSEVSEVEGVRGGQVVEGETSPTIGGCNQHAIIADVVQDLVQ